MVEYGNITGPIIDTYYYSIISLHSMHTVVCIAELKNIETCTGDTSNAYLNVRTTQKIVFNGRSEFAPFGKSGPLLLFKTALYGLKNYGVRFQSKL